MEAQRTIQTLFLFLLAVVRRVHRDFIARPPLAGDLFAGLPKLARNGEFGFCIKL
jgi:hypothetical protein